MAAHLHTQIRNAVATLLGNLTTTGNRVYPNRLHPMDDENLPGLRVFMDTEDVLGSNVDKTQERRLVLVVESCAKESTSLDDELDTSSKEVEIALSGGITIGGSWLNAEYAGMEFEDALDGKPVGVKRLRFFITFTAARNAPDVLI
jgi:hypothetical protein